MLTKKNLISSILSLGLGFILIVLILQFTEVDSSEIIASFYSLNPLYTGLAIATLILHTWLTAYKWNLVTHKLNSDNQQPLRFYLFYTTLGSLTMQFMPQYIGMVAVQNLALRLHNISSFSLFNSPAAISRLNSVCFWLCFFIGRSFCLGNFYRCYPFYY